MNVNIPNLVFGYSLHKICPVDMRYALEVNVGKCKINKKWK